MCSHELSFRHSVGWSAYLPDTPAFPPAPKRAAHQAHRPRVLRPMGRSLDQGPWQSLRRLHHRLLRRPGPLHPPFRLAIPWGALASCRLCGASCRTLFRHNSANSLSSWPMTFSPCRGPLPTTGKALPIKPVTCHPTSVPTTHRRIYCCAPSKARRFLSDERSDVSKPSQ